MPMPRLLLALVTATLVASAPVLAQEPTPTSIPGGSMVTVDQAKAQFDKSALFIDTRTATEFSEKRIRGAQLLAFREQFGRSAKTGPEDSLDLSRLPADKARPIVFYCNGSPCWKGYKAAALAIKGGHTQVFWFRDGLPAWTGKGFPSE